MWHCGCCSASPKPSPSGGIRIRGLRSLPVAHAAVKHSWAAPPPCSASACVALCDTVRHLRSRPRGGIRIRGLRSLSVAHAAVKHGWAAPPPCSASADVALWVLFGISEAVSPVWGMPLPQAALSASCATLAWRLSMVGQLRRPCSASADVALWVLFGIFPVCLSGSYAILGGTCYIIS